MKFLPITILVLLLAPLLLAPLFVSAQFCLPGSYPALYPERPCGTDAYGYPMCFRDYCVGDLLTPGPCQELYDYADYCPLKVCCAVIKIGRWLYFIAAGLAMVIIIWAGVMYMTAGGEGDRAAKAKKLLLYGLVGALIIFASGYILSTVISFLY